MDYISREDAMTDVICEGVSCQECPFLIHPVNGGCKIEEFIKAIPAADVVERKRGKWEYEPWVENLFKIRCNQCGYDEPFVSDKINRNYCPSCGAKMKEE